MHFAWKLALRLAKEVFLHIQNYRWRANIDKDIEDRKLLIYEVDVKCLVHQMHNEAIRRQTVCDLYDSIN